MMKIFRTSKSDLWYLGKRIFDNTEEIQKRKAVTAIRNSKLSSEIEIWASELRDEAFVEKLPYN